MLQINKLRADHVIDFAAEELKKYLRMMMPQCGDIEIRYDPNATEGFRLGLLEDFALPSEAEDPVLDDVIHVDTTENGGILAGSNMRSILFAVYRFLRENGCRWLYPGVDGDYVPMQDIVPTRYHKLADHRFRGHCNEGAESQQAMLDTIDYYAKLELNVYMLEFDNPYCYYNEYYSHTGNEENRPPEPVSYEQVMQWKRQCEVEIAKRGLQFHDMGHGWTAEPFGLSSTVGWKSSDSSTLTEEQRQCLAMLDGVRAPYHGINLNTNLCMSQAKVRTMMVKAIVEYAKKHTNVTYLHVWLADDARNHCECEDCQKMRPADFYLMIMNELDEALTTANLQTRIVFICYLDTLFAPQHVTIQNPERFSLLYAPITRSYCSSLTEDSVFPEPSEYIRNHWEYPRSAEENITHLLQWQKTWKGPVFSYEYHYWRHQYLDPGSMYISRRIYEDIRGLKAMGIDGYVEDGSQRSFFPNGFAMYIYAETLMNRDCDYDAVQEDYYRHIYGDSWKAVQSYLKRVSDTFYFPYMAGEDPEDPAKGSYYNPAAAERLQKIRGLAAEGRTIARDHLAMPDRPKTVSMRLLLRHAEYIEGIASFMTEKALGRDALAREMHAAFFKEFGKYEFELERYFDHYLSWWSFKRAVKAATRIVTQASE